METKKCPYCGKTILAIAKTCKHCGESLVKEEVEMPIVKKEMPKIPVMAIVAGGVFLVVVIFVIVGIKTGLFNRVFDGVKGLFGSKTESALVLVDDYPTEDEEISEEIVPTNDVPEEKPEEKIETVIISDIYDFAYGFSEGLAAVNKGGTISAGTHDLKGGKWGFIDVKGQLVIPMRYDSVGSFSCGLAQVKEGNRIHFIDKKGVKKLTLSSYDYVGNFSEDLAIHYKHGKKSIGFMNTQGAIVIPLIYEDAKDFHEGLAAVKKDGKYGYIDKTGKVIIPFIYDSADDFNDGKAKVRIGDREMYIDKKGRED